MSSNPFNDEYFIWSKSLDKVGLIPLTIVLPNDGDIPYVAGNVELALPILLPIVEGYVKGETSAMCHVIYPSGGFRYS